MAQPGTIKAIEAAAVKVLASWDPATMETDTTQTTLTLQAAKVIERAGYIPLTMKGQPLPWTKHPLIPLARKAVLVASSNFNKKEK